MLHATVVKTSRCERVVKYRVWISIGIERGAGETVVRNVYAYITRRSKPCAPDTPRFRDSYVWPPVWVIHIYVYIRLANKCFADKTRFVDTTTDSRRGRRAMTLAVCVFFLR